MNEILIIPDIHGRTFWETALSYQGKIVFLGDYTDPYPHEGITQENAYFAFSEIVRFKQQHPDRVTLLIGNHELHYYDRQFQASRFSEEYYNKYHAVLTGEKSAGLFQLCKQMDNYLFIHAGITKGWYDLHKTELQSLGDDLETQVNRLFLNNKQAFYEVSGERGGWSRYGSPVWADAHEFFCEQEPFQKDIIQIIGHTQIGNNEPVIRKNIRLLDNQQLYLLRNGQIEHYV
ncbi:MAG: hypothetical protein EZS26_002307 [Candidatus Ordinivivax streblomastigis]|uniref:Calcineurin-like phosphoesterase domain-containing protein n=1 Tax=Candidatus Ordinivivax streblomastigis TaxID=2540710 RepID=A0A5M8NZH3_9BACT|nr:MAG: hypothetical protein EZS26_002307 [Candidatus Ordinivivax streblomastigis]